mmetsp:Transcript_81594/g.214190  ORF Transcript_81594/g.214190 Transcript_81594/m.214190 type:complete len:240 (+) Transcript_81594:134-853(+)
MQNIEMKQILELGGSVRGMHDATQRAGRDPSRTSRLGIGGEPDLPRLPGWTKRWNDAKSISSRPPVAAEIMSAHSDSEMSSPMPMRILCSALALRTMARCCARVLGTSSSSSKKRKASVSSSSSVMGRATPSRNKTNSANSRFPSPLSSMRLKNMSSSLSVSLRPRVFIIGPNSLRSTEPLAFLSNMAKRSSTSAICCASNADTMVCSPCSTACRSRRSESADRWPWRFARLPPPFGID